MKRYIEPFILNDLSHKIVLISGPRQCGKTTLSKQLSEHFDYFNYDAHEDRLALQDKAWDRDQSLIIFDEIHKMKKWKQWLKGIYDKEGIPPQLIVTGSAKLDTYRKVGDSLAGRYFQYRLHPLDLKEIAQQNIDIDPAKLFEQFWQCSGFPEPFLKGSETYYKRWQRTHLDIILRQDLIDIHAIRDIKAIETLVALLKNRVGSTVSYANLARDLERDPKTIKRWLQLLENLYVIYKVTPYHKNIARSLLKEPKYYFYDHCQVANGDGAQLENIVANALHKQLHYLTDTTGSETHLHFLRTKEGKEMDFLVVMDEKPCYLIEVKRSDSKPSLHFNHFQQYFPNIKKIQLVHYLSRQATYPDGVAVKSLIPWLINIHLDKECYG